MLVKLVSQPGEDTDTSSLCFGVQNKKKQQHYRMVQKLTYVDDQQGTLLVKLVKKPGGIPPACVMHIKTKLVISS